MHPTGQFGWRPNSIKLMLPQNAEKDEQIFNQLTSINQNIFEENADELCLINQVSEYHAEYNQQFEANESEESEITINQTHKKGST